MRPGGERLVLQHKAEWNDALLRPDGRRAARWHETCPLSTGAKTRRVRLVRGKDETCPVSKGGGGVSAAAGRYTVRAAGLLRGHGEPALARRETGRSSLGGGVGRPCEEECTVRGTRTPSTRQKSSPVAWNPEPVTVSSVRPSSGPADGATCATDGRPEKRNGTKLAVKSTPLTETWS